MNLAHDGLAIGTHIMGKLIQATVNYEDEKRAGHPKRGFREMAGIANPLYADGVHGFEFLRASPNDPGHRLCD